MSKRPITKLKEKNPELVKRIEEDPELRKYLINRDEIIKPQTKIRYIITIEKYCLFHQMTPSELIKEAKDEQKTEEFVDMPPTDTQLFYRLRTYHEFLLENKTKYNTMNRDIHGIKGFYKHRGVKALPSYKIKRPEYDPQPEPESENLPSKEILQELLQKANEKYRAIILLMNSSGMGGAEIKNLKYRDFLDAITCKVLKKDRDQVEFSIDLDIERDYGNIFLIEQKVAEAKEVVPVWSVRRIKTGGNPYRTFSTPETVVAIIKYLKWRFYHGVMPELDGYLFIGRDPNKKMGQATLQQTFRRLALEIGIKANSYEYHSLRPHNLRHRFLTILGNCNVPLLFTKFLKGNRLDDDTRTYYYRDTYKYRRIYIKNMDKLSIEDIETKIIVDGNYQRLDEAEKEIEKLKDLLNESEKKLIKAGMSPKALDLEGLSDQVYEQVIKKLTASK